MEKTHETDEAWEVRVSRANRCDWTLLSEPEKSEERNALDPELMETASFAFVDEQIESINRHFYVLMSEAQVVADTFMTAEKAARNDPDLRTFIRVRVRMTDYQTVDISWHRLVPGRYPLKGKESGKKVFYKEVNGQKMAFPAKSQRLKKGKSYRYTSAQFKKEPDWVIQMVELCENKFEIIRKQSEKLSQCRKALYLYSSLTGDLFDQMIGDAPGRIRPRTAKDFLDAESEGSYEDFEDDTD